MRAAFQSLLMPVLMVDPHRENAPVAFANRALLDLTGYSQEELSGRSWHLLHMPGSGVDALTAIDAATQAGEALETGFVGRRKDGAAFECTLALSPVRDETGRLRWATLVLTGIGSVPDPHRDVTAASRDLEEHVERRTKALQTALDRRTALLHEVEHRIKNTLQMTASLVLLKARRLRDPEARRVLQETAERVSALSAAHRLLSASGDAGRFNLQEFTAELAGELVTALPKGQVDLDLDIQPLGVPAPKATALALLLNELIGNAVKHAFPNGRRGRLTIEIGRAENGLKIAVEDDGVGLDHAPATEGSFGKTLITMLVQQLKGQLTWRDQKPGTRAEIAMPVDAQEMKFE